MIIGNSFDSLSYNIQQGMKANQPSANPAPTSSPIGSPPQGQGMVQRYIDQVDEGMAPDGHDLAARGI